MAHHVVPRTTEVIPGAPVNIVLKADQRTGRQVHGVVRDVLTRGDHHRGIKVRLTDGRIGRVQSMASSSTSSPSSSDSPALNSPMPSLDAQMSSRGRGQQPRYRDARLDEPPDAAPEQMDLGAYIVPPKRKGKGRKGAKTDQADGLANSDHTSQSDNLDTTKDLTTATATCPVCDAFEGDEAAVAHHVAGHFE